MSGGSGTIIDPKTVQQRFGVTDKYVIQFGREPNDTTFKNNIRVYEQWALDGMVVVPFYTDPVFGSSINASWRIATTYRLNWNLFSTALANLEQVDCHKFTQNFLRVNLCTAGDLAITNPGERLDWFCFDDMKTMSWNLKIMARLAKRAGFRGLLLDNEAYNSSAMWNYANVRGSQSFSAYQAEVYKWAKNFMHDMATEYPDITLLLALGYEQLANGSTDLTINNYGLMPKFLDGLHDGCPGGATIVNGCEASYFNAGAGTDADMIAYYKAWQEDASNMSNLGRVLGSSNYFNAHETAFSIWLDADSDAGHPIWDTASPWSNNFWTPSTFQTAMETRLNNAKRYVWIYNQIPRFTGDPVPWANKCPYEYGVDAIKSAKVTVGIDVAYDPKLFGAKNSCQWLWDPSAAGLVNNDVPQTLTNQNGGANHFTQATAGKRATYKTNISGTLGMLLFDDTQSQCYANSALATPFSGTDKPFTVICGVKLASTAPAAVQTLWSIGHSSTANASIAGRANTSPRWQAQRIDDSGSSTNFNGELFNSGRLGTNFNIVVFRSTGTIAEISVNTVVSVAAAAQDKGTTSLNTFYIGAQYVAGVESLYMKNYLIPYAIFSDFIEDGQVWAMVRHLSKLAGIETI